jgi:hypothetical protein
VSSASRAKAVATAYPDSTVHAVAAADNDRLTTEASAKKTEAHQRKVVKANKAAMSAAPSPVYIRRDEPDNPGNWVLVSPVLDADAAIEDAAYYICTWKHKQPEIQLTSGSSLSLAS